MTLQHAGRLGVIAMLLVAASACAPTAQGPTEVHVAAAPAGAAQRTAKPACELHISYRMLDEAHQPLARVPYAILLGEGQVLSGVSDSLGGFRECAVEAGDFCLEMDGYYIYVSVTRAEWETEEQTSFVFFRRDFEAMRNSARNDPVEFQRRCERLSSSAADTISAAP